MTFEYILCMDESNLRYTWVRYSSTVCCSRDGGAQVSAGVEWLCSPKAAWDQGKPFPWKGPNQVVLLARWGSVLLLHMHIEVVVTWRILVGEYLPFFNEQYPFLSSFQKVRGRDIFLILWTFRDHFEITCLWQIWSVSSLLSSLDASSLLLGQFVPLALTHHVFFSFFFFFSTNVKLSRPRKWDKRHSVHV